MTTIHDVARRAGVSPVTVSRVLNGASNVNASTREKVEQAIQELGYLPNRAARSLRSGQTSTLALILPDITNAFWTTVARGVEDAAQSEGYLVWLCNTDESLEKQQGYINAVLQQRVDGVIIAPYNADAANLHKLRELHTPVVVLDRHIHGWDVDSVHSDSVSGAYALVNHLIELGHTRIAVVSGPSVTSTAEERVAGHCLALEDAGIAIDPRLIRRGEYRARSGRQMTDLLLEDDVNPTAIFATNNALAMGVLESLYDHGKRVPQDIAVVCFDELPDMARLYPFLTSAVQPAYDIGVNAAQLLLSRINESAPLQPRHVVLPSRLVLRHSCGRFMNQAEPTVQYFPPLEDRSETRLIKPIAGLDKERIYRYAPSLRATANSSIVSSRPLDMPDAWRVQTALRHQPTDRLPHIETRVPPKAVLEYVLERSLPYREEELGTGRQTLSAADWVNFAQRVGIDAVPCEIDWLSGALRQESTPPDRRAFPAPLLAEHFTRLEGFLRAAGAGGIGVFAVFPSFFSAALERMNADGLEQAWANHPDRFERWMERLADTQEMVIRAVCDRFSTGLSFLLIREPLLAAPLPEHDPSSVWTTFFHHFRQVILPAREHGLVVGIETTGAPVPYLDKLVESGVGLLVPVDVEQNYVEELLERWQGRLAISVGFPAGLFASASAQEVEARAVSLYQKLVGRNGLLFGVSPAVAAGTRPENYLAMAQAMRRLEDRVSQAR